MFGLQQNQMAMNPFSGGGMAGMNALGAPGFGGQMGGMDAMMAQQAQMSSMTDQMMSAMSSVVQMMMMQSMQAMMSAASNFGGGAAGSGSPGIGNFLGGDSSGGGAAPASGASEAASTSAASGGDGNGSKAVEIAQKYLGQKSGNINDMANFTHAGGMTNNCADFVSACLANAGVYKKKSGDASVRILKQHLQEDGWKKVAKAQAKPGDVAIFNGTQHIELVSKAGATELIGSNNKGNASTQTVSTDSGNWGSVEYLTKG